MDRITKLQDITLFAPSNAAWEEEGVKHILQDKKRFREILNLHYVREKLPLDKIKQKSINQVSFLLQWFIIFPGSIYSHENFYPSCVR